MSPVCGARLIHKDVRELSILNTDLAFRPLLSHCRDAVPPGDQLSMATASWRSALCDHSLLGTSSPWPQVSSLHHTHTSALKDGLFTWHSPGRPCRSRCVCAGCEGVPKINSAGTIFSSLLLLLLTWLFPRAQVGWLYRTANT